MKSVIDFSNPVESARFRQDSYKLEGRWTVELKRYRATRSNQQNRAYWGMVVPVFADWLTAQWGYLHTPEDAHHELKLLVLGRDVVNPHTGEVKRIAPPTHTMTTEQFSDFFERARAEVERLTGRHIDDPDPSYVTVSHA